MCACISVRNRRVTHPLHTVCRLGPSCLLVVPDANRWSTISYTVFFFFVCSEYVLTLLNKHLIIRRGEHTPHGHVVCRVCFTPSGAPLDAPTVPAAVVYLFFLFSEKPTVSSRALGLVTPDADGNTPFPPHDGQSVNRPASQRHRRRRHVQVRLFGRVPVVPVLRARRGLYVTHRFNIDRRDRLTTIDRGLTTDDGVSATHSTTVRNRARSCGARVVRMAVAAAAATTIAPVHVLLVLLRMRRRRLSTDYGHSSAGYGL